MDAAEEKEMSRLDTGRIWLRICCNVMNPRMVAVD